MPQNILVIDDEKLIRWTLEQHLAKEGYEVVTADSAEKGLAIINDEAPDLIPRDNRLPEIAGLALAYGNALCTGTGPHGDHDYRHLILRGMSCSLIGQLGPRPGYFHLPAEITSTRMTACA